VEDRRPLEHVEKWIVRRFETGVFGGRVYCHRGEALMENELDLSA